MYCLASWLIFFIETVTLRFRVMKFIHYFEVRSAVHTANNGASRKAKNALLLSFLLSSVSVHPSPSVANHQPKHAIKFSSSSNDQARSRVERGRNIEQRIVVRVFHATNKELVVLVIGDNFVAVSRPR
jgi:phosphatidylserine/phosphatidylglycerophosphate/cardiolipin synthase-like enzyme